jgi:hypothetical protein
MDILGSIDGDLRTLSVDARKKHSAVKEVLLYHPLPFLLPPTLSSSSLSRLLFR